MILSESETVLSGSLIVMKAIGNPPFDSTIVKMLIEFCGCLRALKPNEVYLRHLLEQYVWCPTEISSMNFCRYQRSIWSSNLSYYRNPLQLTSGIRIHRVVPPRTFLIRTDESLRLSLVYIKLRLKQYAPLEYLYWTSAAIKEALKVLFQDSAEIRSNRLQAIEPIV